MKFIKVCNFLTMIVCILGTFICLGKYASFPWAVATLLSVRIFVKE